MQNYLVTFMLKIKFYKGGKPLSKLQKKPIQDI